jgi:hypothetical protein
MRSSDPEQSGVARSARSFYDAADFKVST